MSSSTLTRGNGQPEDFWTISGRLTSAVTGNPVSRFQVWAGDENFPGDVRLDPRRPIEGIDGVFTVRVNKQYSAPVLKFAAADYLPKLVALPQDDRNNFDIALQPGAGPSGRILLPDGRPAAFVTVTLLHSEHVKILENGELHSGRIAIGMTDAAGRFKLSPELNMEWIVASSSSGFALASVADFRAGADLSLQPWGRIKGVLKWPTGPGANEKLDLAMTCLKPNGRWSLDIGNHIATDQEGRFDFPRVPPGELQLTYQVSVDERRWRTAPLMLPFTLNAGQTLEFPLEPKVRKTPENFFIRQPEPAVKSAPPLNGVVLLADGQPAANADVGLVVPNECLPLHRCSLRHGRDTSLKTTTDSSGRFELPGVQGVRAVVAVHRTGFAKVSPVSDGHALALTLQPWGRISGTLRIGKRLGANERVTLAASGSFKEQRMFHYTQAYEARTDSEGRFVLTFVPPGEHSVSRQIPMGENSWRSGIPTIIDVKPGETTVVTLGGTGRQVVGKIIPKEGASPVDWTGVKISLFTFQYGPPKELKAQAERAAWDESPEGRIAVNKRRHYDARIGEDGAFAFEEVDPEEYSLSVRRTRVFQNDRGHEHHDMMLGNKNVTIPATTADDKAAPFDVGIVEADLSLQFPPRPQ